MRWPRCSTASGPRCTARPRTSSGPAAARRMSCRTCSWSCGVIRTGTTRTPGRCAAARAAPRGGRHARRLRRIARQERHYRLTIDEGPPSPGEQVLSADLASEVQAAIQRLPAAQRQVVELAYFEGMTCREVASAVGIPEGTVKSRLRLALAKLEAVLDRQLLEAP